MQAESIAGVVHAVAARHRNLASILSGASPEELADRSGLPGWSRLTIVCHLRYGAQANYAMTVDALAGRPASFYPQGRGKQRPLTLVPEQGEAPGDVVASFFDESTKLDELWRSLEGEHWARTAHEPTDNPDLGTITLGTLALLRLTEVEVHGLDLNLGAKPWSDTFVEEVFPARVRSLGVRRSNHTPIDPEVHGTWVLRPTMGTSFVVCATPDGVSVAESDGIHADVEISGSTRSLLGWILGRVGLSSLSISGNQTLAAAFDRAFPAP